MPVDRWFVSRVPVNRFHHLNAYLVAMMGKRFGPGIAKPEFLNVGEFRPIVEWILEKRREGKSCCVACIASNAVWIARVALEMGVSLEGTKFTAGGEPLTESKRAVIERAGARAAQNFAYGMTIQAGLACGNPSFTGEVHVQQSQLALVEHPRPLDDSAAPVAPLLLTTMHR